MSKQRVHEYARENNMQAKEVISLLENAGVRGKKVMSSINADEMKLISNSVKNKSTNNDVKPATKDTSSTTNNAKNTSNNNATRNNNNATSSDVKPASQTATPAKQEATSKPTNSENKSQQDASKSNVSSDELKKMRPHRNNTNNTNNNNNNNNGNRPQGDRPYNNNGNRPQGDRPYNNNGNRPQGDRPYNNNNGNRPQGDRPYNNNGNRPQGDRPYNNNNGNRPQGDRPYNNNGNRPQGDRPYNNNGNRPQGDRPYNNNGNRPQGDRPYNNNGNRPQGDRPYNNNGNRPQGDRPYNNNNNGNRPQGDRPYNNNGNRPQGNRPYNSNGNGYQGNSQGNRPYNNNGNSNGSQGNRQGGYNNNSNGYGNRPGGYNNSQGQKKDETKQRPEENRNLEKVNKKVESRKKSKKKAEIKEAKWAEQVDVLNDIKSKKKKDAPKVAEIKMIEVGDSITLKELAEKLSIAPKDIIMKLFKDGVIATVNQSFDFEKASEIAESYDVLCEPEVMVDILESAFETEEAPEDLRERPPVVVVMGHVDHGKTSLLDAIKKSKVVNSESGGITQHIGAYTVESKGKTITFLDTPGHEAFTAMRMRGAQVTDIAVLVVAADDGVMPQTIEAISHAKAANVEIIVAINKIDKPGANPERVKQELTEHGIVVSEWGGTIECVDVSAKVGTGIDDLLDMINLTAEMKELKADYSGRVKGTVIEASLDKGRGVVATMLVQSGTLKIGTPLVVGSSYGRVRAMVNDKGEKVTKVLPSYPVEILGLSTVPNAGDMFYVADNERQARQLAESIDAQNRTEMIKLTKNSTTLDDLFSQMQSGELKDLNIIIKADVQGSVEAVRTSLEKLSNDEIRVRVIHGAVGAINESDISLAATSNAIVIGFNVKPDVTAKALAESEGVDLRLYSVIYHAIDAIQLAMNGMYAPVYEEKVMGYVEVRQIFRSSAAGTIAGSYVTDGKITRKASVRLKRGTEVVYEGELESLKRFKDEVKEVAKGYECGIVLPKFNDIKEGDIFEAYEMVEVPRT